MIKITINNKGYMPIGYKKHSDMPEGSLYLSDDGNLMAKGVNYMSEDMFIFLKPVETRLGCNEKFYAVSVAPTGQTRVVSRIDAECITSELHFKNGNYFSRKAEAQFYADKINKMFEERVA